ncbi:c-type cytochrome [Roseovarius faecimaris]|uniref:C-type cytochrome n=1 Tax=Roseovarius faecimaris TaxID=2494550 RepID=A0A6I6IPA6_9RHOB|nr:c-type cytochrome [Roseovarius faecimaris]QGX97036.1 c-type cytochrome [Roseovarius faecimaris]
MRTALAIALALAGPAPAQEFFTLKGHGGPIMDIAVSPTGQIATASFDNSVGLWEGAVPRWLEGNRAAVNTVLIPGNGAVFAGGDDFTLWGWEAATGAAREIGAHTAKITALDMSADGAWLASASWDATVGLWPLAGGEPVFLRGHEKGVNDVVFSADASLLYSASVDGTIRIWDVATGQEKRRLVKHGFGVNTLSLNEAEGWIAYGAVDGGTRMIDIASGEQIADFTLERRPILSMDYHPGTAQLAAGDGQGYIMVIDTEARRITRDFRAARNGPIWALAFSPDGQNIHAGGIEDILYSWPVETMDEHGQMSAETRSFLENPEELPNGERQFKRKCSICHTLTEGSARKAGPSLHKLFGRRAGTVADYTYSDILEGSEIIWNEETIDALFDEGPDHYIPGTKMPMQRIVKSKDREDLIAYLRQATAPGGE